MSGRTIFWDVDTQIDFIDPAGKLFVPGAHAIVPNLKRLTQWAARNNVRVIASACAHHQQDPEFAQYPPHCLAGTPGQKKIPETTLGNAYTIPNRMITLPDDLDRYQQLVVEKQQLDVFSNPNVESLLAQLSPIREVVIYGVVTELCVSCATRGLMSRGHRLEVVTDAVRHLDEVKANELLNEVSRSGGRLVSTDEVCSRQSFNG